MSSEELLKKDYKVFIEDNPMQIPEINESS